MSPAYNEDRVWSDQWIPEIKKIVGPLLLAPTTFEQDTEQVADLIILKARDMRIGARIRRSGYAELYPNEFTIRSERESGTATEMAKIVYGWGDWFFYGHEHRGEIWPWYLINLDSFRAVCATQGLFYLYWNKKPTLRWGIRDNGDGTKFCWFDIMSFPDNPPLLIAKSDPTPSHISLF